MKGTWIRWIAAVLMLIGLSLLVSSPSIAETKKASNSLPLDMKVPGKPPKKNGWNKDFTKYKDSTIEMSVEKSSLTPTEQLRKRKNSALETLIIRVKIKDPSQIRTAMSKDTYTGSERVEAEVMAKAKNAVLAINGDFFKYHQTWGYVVRQGVFYRDKTDSKYKIDMLAIDSQGDFHIVYQPVKDTTFRLPTDEVILRVLGLYVRAGRVDDVLRAEFLPGNLGSVAFAVDQDLLAVDDDAVFRLLQRAGEASVDRIILDHVDHVIDVRLALGDRYDVEYFGLLQRDAQRDAADAAEAINA